MPGPELEACELGWSVGPNGTLPDPVSDTDARWSIQVAGRNTVLRILTASGPVTAG